MAKKSTRAAGGTSSESPHQKSPADALTESDTCFRHTGKVIVPLTVKGILEEQLARKLA